MRYLLAPLLIVSTAHAGRLISEEGFEPQPFAGWATNAIPDGAWWRLGITPEQLTGIIPESVRVFSRPGHNQEPLTQISARLVKAEQLPGFDYVHHWFRADARDLLPGMLWSEMWFDTPEGGLLKYNSTVPLADVVPEPSTIVLLLLAAIGLSTFARR